jgi:hypothetical protein
MRRRESVAPIDLEIAREALMAGVVIGHSWGDP